MQEPRWDKLDDFIDPDKKPRLNAMESHIGRFSKDEVRSFYADDPWFQNIALNVWEYVSGTVRLESYPWNITLPIADICNARCTFCTSWLAGTNFLKPDQLARYDEVLPFAYHFGYQGHGEPLANPHIEELLAYFGARLDPRCFTYTITNGVYLKKLMDQLLETRIDLLNVSLNATTPDVHDTVMGLGPAAFDQIIQSLRTVREKSQGKTNFTISMVLTADNFHQAADFVRLGNDLGAQEIYLRTIAPSDGIPAGLNYHKLAPNLLPDFEKHRESALQAISESKVNVEAYPETWAHDSVTEAVRKRLETQPVRTYTRREAQTDKAVRAEYAALREDYIPGMGEHIEFIDNLTENRYRREAPFSCKFVYYNLISTVLTWNLVPCCYMSKVPGHNNLSIQDNVAFHELWNSDAYIELRRRLQQGPLFQACATCPMQGR